jgi:hypothetical protein
VGADVVRVRAFPFEQFYSPVGVVALFGLVLRAEILRADVFLVRFILQD